MSIKSKRTNNTNDVTQAQTYQATGTLFNVEKVPYTGESLTYYVYNSSADANSGNTSLARDTITISPSTAFSLSLGGNSSNCFTDQYAILRTDNNNLVYNSESLYVFDPTFDASKITYDIP